MDRGQFWMQIWAKISVSVISILLGTLERCKARAKWSATKCTCRRATHRSVQFIQAAKNRKQFKVFRNVILFVPINFVLPPNNLPVQFGMPELPSFFLHFCGAMFCSDSDLNDLPLVQRYFVYYVCRLSRVYTYIHTIFIVYLLIS